MISQVIISAFLACTTIVHAQGNLIPGALGGVLGNATTAPVPDRNCDDYVCQAAQLATAGISVQILNESIQIGAVTLPPDTLCRVSNITFDVSCHVCSIDCLSVHNRFGGYCGEDTVPGSTKGYVCVCYDEPQPQAANGIYPTPQESCNPLTTPDFDALVLNPVLTVALKNRYVGTQCFEDGTGCGVDCLNNHQYDNGNCGFATPRSDSSDTKEQGFCECTYKTTSGGSTTETSFTPANASYPAPVYVPTTTTTPAPTTKKSLIGTIIEAIGGIRG